MKVRGIKMTVKVDVLRVARGVRLMPRAARFGCGKHPSRAATKRTLRREM